MTGVCDHQLDRVDEENIAVMDCGQIAVEQGEGLFCGAIFLLIRG